jgi:hypothetical protein
MDRVGCDHLAEYGLLHDPAHDRADHAAGVGRVAHLLDRGAVVLLGEPPSPL